MHGVNNMLQYSEIPEDQDCEICDDRSAEHLYEFFFVCKLCLRKIKGHSYRQIAAYRRSGEWNLD
jgi:ribosomal protein L37AE/L43A